jgi:Polysaccharide lyase
VIPKTRLSMLIVFLALAASPAHATAAHSDPFQSTASPSSLPGQSAQSPWADFDGGFETGDFSQYLEVQAASGRASIVQSPVAEGSYAARFERQVGDELIAGSNRSEAVPNREFHAGETRYFRQLLYLPFESIDWGHFLILCQWHDSSPGTPPLTLQTFEVEGVKKLLIGSGSRKQIYYEFNIPGSSQWFELVYRITFGSSGSMQVWLNGKSIGEVEGIDTLGTEPTNWKVGAYRSGEAEGTTVIYQDGVMVTKNFFSNPPKEPSPPSPTPPVVPAAAQASSQPPTPSPNAAACQRATDELRKARARLNAAHRRAISARSPTARRKGTQQVALSAKRFHAAKLNAQRLCRAS